jgi:hypothetical protein
MSKLEMTKMEKIQAGFDCSNENRLAFIGGATVGGAIFFGWGAVVTGYAALVYSSFKCDGKH